MTNPRRRKRRTTQCTARLADWLYRHTDQSKEEDAYYEDEDELIDDEEDAQDANVNQNDSAGFVEKQQVTAVPRDQNTRDTHMTSDKRFVSERFPRSSQYHPEWIIANASSGGNSMWLTEWLTEAMDLKPGMRVLDLACGRACTSIFLHREFGVQVWAADLWFNPSGNTQRIKDAGADGSVFPIRADALDLPFARDFFDAIICIDSYFYFGTDDLYLSNLARFVKPGGAIGIAQAGWVQEIEPPVPDHIRPWWEQDTPWCLHSASWWRRHWERTGIMNVELADTMPDGWQHWLEWQNTVAPDNKVEIKALEDDRGAYLGYVRMIGCRGEAELHDPPMSIPSEYVKKPLLRDEE